MKFKQFLIEKSAASSRHELTYQKLLMALDKAHVSKTDNYYEFNLGSVVKDSSLSKLFVRIQQGQQIDVKLGQHKDGRYFLVIFTPKLPERMEIDSLLSTNKEIMSGFVDAVSDYYNNYKSEDSEPNDNEKAEALYDKKNLESKYDELINAIEVKYKEYKAAIDELESQKNSTINASKKVSLEQAQKKLTKEYFGDNQNEFIKKVKKLPEAEFIALIDKDRQKTIDKRLQNYYEQKLK